MRITVVDDDAIICENVCSKLKRLINPNKLRFDMAYNAIDAELIIEKTCPDIVITDLNMPGVSGLTLVKRIKTKWPDIRVYVLSGYDDYSLVRKAFLNGADDYLLKPLDIDELKDKVVIRMSTTEKEEIMLNKNDWMMDKAIAYINENICRNITMDEVAKNVAVSYNYFSKLFSDSTGMGFREYIHRRRIELSKRYLADSSIKITDIARKVGYESSSSFSKAFKKYDGCYPTNYRNSLDIHTDWLYYNIIIETSYRYVKKAKIRRW